MTQLKNKDKNEDYNMINYKGYNISITSAKLISEPNRYTCAIKDPNGNVIAEFDFDGEIPVENILILINQHI
ncbi:hypothetical protein SDC9_203710 [bioreactor metagenome]|uniref:Uncharacterized protein n=1 Tax=bioreactor metagenome TaxID=1076179 RepID=A0A645IX72_9ZZZZ